MMGNVHEIAPGLYLGSEGGLEQVDELRVTHVLSVTEAQPRKCLDWDFKPTCLHIHLCDSPDANLLKSLPQSLNFIHTALTGQPLLTPAGKPLEGTADMPQQQKQNQQLEPRVFVHCHKGISRSASVVIAYLMKTRKWRYQEAFQNVEERRQVILPNAGFQKQLELFADMQYTIDPKHPGYRMWNMQWIGTTLGHSQGYVYMYARPEENCFANLTNSQELREQEGACMCAECGTLLGMPCNMLTSEDIAASHQWSEARLKWLLATSMRRGWHEMRPAYDRLKEQKVSDVSEQMSVFFEPMAWMEEAARDLSEGDLQCPGCKTTMGSFKWTGIITKEGNRVAPAFYVHASKQKQNGSKQAVTEASTQHHAQQESATASGTEGSNADDITATAYIPVDAGVENNLERAETVDTSSESVVDAGGRLERAEHVERQISDVMPSIDAQKDEMAGPGAGGKQHTYSPQVLPIICDLDQQEQAAYKQMELKDEPTADKADKADVLQLASIPTDSMSMEGELASIGRGDTGPIVTTAAAQTGTELKVGQKRTHSMMGLQGQLDKEEPNCSSKIQKCSSMPGYSFFATAFARIGAVGVLGSVCAGLYVLARNYGEELYATV